ncbi:MAG: HlyD family efflux transporter periplasmic adaptor subunit [Halofilum sp. (in: g-proteobacteria)]|nr:HlyD family efflux transporter periplasmic adaptor subunit [Halofilum sp. (in: g-proteobacteria)]
MNTAAGEDPAAQPLPPMRPDLRLSRGAPDEDGTPMWVLFDPLRNRYFHLSRRGLRLLRHWQAGAGAGEIARRAAAEGVEVDAEDVAGMARFLLDNGLTVASTPADSARLAAQQAAQRTRWWQWLLHRYLFFRIPLFRPDPFLARNIHRVRWLGGRTVRWFVLLLGAIGIVLALRQWEAFTGTFLRFLNWEGVAWYALALIAVKTAHELAHAFIARYHGCRVPSMGIAFLVLFPVLYTDATDTWRLRHRRERLRVALGGVATELAIALLATFLWSFLPPGGARDAAFFLATTSWVTSLLINLSPFMRFDGYHALSDLWGVDNLQPRAFALARWRLREALFGFGEPPPERFRPRRRRMLVIYAFATWIYRFFLFLGIALLVYHVAFKALGIVLFIVELTWFIGRPIAMEVIAMFQRPWTWNRATARSLVLLGLFAAALFVPWRSTLPLPAVLDARIQARLHPPEAARVAAVAVEPGQRVAAGDSVVRLENPELRLQAEQAGHRIDLIRARLDRRAGSLEDLAAETVLRQRLAEQQVQRAGLLARQQDLNVRSPVAGTVVRRADLRPGQWVARSELLAEIVGDQGVEIIAYVREHTLGRVEVGARGRFIPDDGAHPALDVRVVEVEDVGAERLPHRMLADRWGGPLPVESAGEDKGDPRLAEGIYRVRLEPVQSVPVPEWRLPGRASIEAPPESLAGRFLRYAAAVLVRESGF